jgi:hypothetical protein
MKSLSASAPASNGTTRRGFLTLAASSPLALAAPMTVHRASKRRSPPTVHVAEGRGRNLVELADLFLALADEHADAEGEYQDIRDALGKAFALYRQDSSSHDVGEEIEQLNRDDALADERSYAVLQRREQTYRDLRREVEAILAESGVEPGKYLDDEFQGYARPLALVVAGGYSFMLVGSFAFFEGPYKSGWGDTEVVIL